MNKLWFKRTVGVLAVLVLLASCSLSPAADAEEDRLQSQIDEQNRVQSSLNSDLDSLQEEMDVINGRITDLNSRISEYNKVIAQYQSEIDSLELQIDEAEKRQTELEAQISDTYELLGDRLYATYVAGSTSTLELLLSAEDFETFLTRLELVRRISEYDTSLVSDLQADIDELETTKAQLDADKAAVEQKQAAEQSARDALASDRAEELEARSLQVSKQNEIEAQLNKSEALQEDLEQQMEEYVAKKAQEMENGSGTIDSSGSNSGNYTVSSKGMICPLQYSNVYVSAGWYGYANHKGIDFCTRGATGNTYGKEIRAAADGKVYSAEYHYSWGYNVYINHGNGVYTRYAHCSRMVVSAGQDVTQGQVIAYVGNTGNVSPRPSASNPHAGAHLHFEVWVNGTRVNPEPWLP